MSLLRRLSTARSQKSRRELSNLRLEMFKAAVDYMESWEKEFARCDVWGQFDHHAAGRAGPISTCVWRVASEI